MSKDESKNQPTTVTLPPTEIPEAAVDPSPVPKQCRCHGDLEKGSVIVGADGKCQMCGRQLFGQPTVTVPAKKVEDDTPKTEDVARVKKFVDGMYFVERLPNGAFGRLIYIESMNDKEITFREPGMEKIARPNWMVKFPAYKDQPHILRDKQPCTCGHQAFRTLLQTQHFERVIDDQLVRTMAAV